MELYAHQIKAIKEAKDKWGLWFRMRVGKTPTAIRLVCERAGSGLIISPKSLVKQWEEEIDIWNNNNSVFKVISRDQFKIKHDKLEKFDAVVIDEGHRGFANYKSQMHKALQSYLKKHEIKYIWLLSGTPYTSTSWSIYSYGKILGRDWKWFDWNKTFFNKIKMGRRFIPIAKKGMDKQLQAILRKIGTVIDLKDVADVMDDIDIKEYFDLNAEQKKYIKEIDADLPIVRYGQQHQFESGVLKSDGYREKISFKCDKDKRILELVEDNDKIIIVAKYLDQIEKYQELLKKYKVFTISGQIKETASEVAKMAENEAKCVVLVQSDTSDGYSLKSFNTMVFASMSYSFVNYDQIKSRMKSIQKLTPLTYIHLLTKGKSLDQAVFDSVSKKQNFSIGLYNNE